MGLFSRKYSPFGIAISLIVCAGAGVSEADGAVFTVNSTVDAVDAVPGDGVCATGANVCTLRAAVMETNALSGLDTILLSFFPSPFALSIPPTSPPGVDDSDAAAGDLDITDDAFILPTGFAIGSGVVDGGHLDRVFEIHSPAVVAIAGITIRHGDTVEAVPSNHQRHGGGILNRGLLTLISVIVEANISESGGGIVSAGPLTLLNTTVSSNTGIRGGGGISNSVSPLTLTNSSVRDNITHGVGAGILNHGVLHLTASTVSGNAASPARLAPGQSLGAGGIHNGDLAILTNSTISGNSSSEGAGIAGPGDLFLRNSTVAANSGKGLRTGETLLINTIVANNSGGDCDPLSSAPLSVGHNLDSDGTCNLFQPSDFSGANPLLGPLTNNGGLTETHALQNGSPAIDAGNDARCPPTDQRGVIRPQGPRCDIGAYERADRRR